MRKSLLVIFACLALASCARPDRTLHIITTNDVHGAWFDSTYVGGKTVPSLLAVNTYVDSIRAAVGKNNVLLLDAGDCLQGDNAAYYFNYVDTTSMHLYARMARYMGYDAVTVGNHDIETGHHVYDRVGPELAAYGIPFLGGNALTESGASYFGEFKVFKKAGMKVLVLGYTNANIQAWLDQSIWSGMQFESLIPFVQARVDEISAKVKPDVVVVSVHSGTGHGDGTVLESQGLDLLNSLRGVDLVVCAHDHRPVAIVRDSIALVNAGSKANNYSHTQISLQGGKKSITSCIEKVDKSKADPKMRERFQADYDKVKAFTVREVGSITESMRSRDAYAGKCFYIDFIHYVQLRSSGADISFAAPLSFNKSVEAGKVIYNDMFTIYPFENTLNVMSLKGSEIKSYLEYSYGRWIDPRDGHVFNMSERDDQRYFQKRWSFNAPSYNFDSAAGINYMVDITKPEGSRVKILSMADGSAFEMDKMYSVAMTSYRAAGGGDLLFKGAGLTREELDGRLVARYPEIRDLIYQFFEKQGSVSPEDIEGIGDWQFVPTGVADKAVARDMELMFP